MSEFRYAMVSDASATLIASRSRYHGRAEEGWRRKLRHGCEQNFLSPRIFIQTPAVSQALTMNVFAAAMRTGNINSGVKAGAAGSIKQQVRSRPRPAGTVAVASTLPTFSQLRTHSHTCLMSTLSLLFLSACNVAGARYSSVLGRAGCSRCRLAEQRVLFPQSKEFFTQKDKETEIKGIQFTKARLGGHRSWRWQFPAALQLGAAGPPVACTGKDSPETPLLLPCSAAPPPPLQFTRTDKSVTSCDLGTRVMTVRARRRIFEISPVLTSAEPRTTTTTTLNGPVDRRAVSDSASPLPPAAPGWRD